MRLLAAALTAALAPVVAWWVWVSPVDGKPSDARHVLWFATVAVVVLGAGALAPRTRAAVVVTSVVAVVATMTTLYRWWSSEDSSGLFLVGVLLALPAVAVVGPALVVAGRGLRTARRRGAAAPGR